MIRDGLVIAVSVSRSHAPAWERDKSYISDSLLLAPGCLLLVDHFSEIDGYRRLGGAQARPNNAPEVYQVLPVLRTGSLGIA